MSTIDLTPHAAQDLDMRFGEYRIVSPVPDAHTGMILSALWEAGRKATAALEDTDKDGAEVAEALNAEIAQYDLSDTDKLDRLVLGNEQVDDLIKRGCPPLWIRQAGQFAFLRWVLDSVPAAMEWIEGESDANNPKAPNRKQRRASKR